MRPIKSCDRDRTGSQYWKCPVCGSKVGGYEIYGSGDDDWGYSQDNFCRRCGQQIEWEYEV